MLAFFFKLFEALYALLSRVTPGPGRRAVRTEARAVRERLAATEVELAEERTLAAAVGDLDRKALDRKKVLRDDAHTIALADAEQLAALVNDLEEPTKPPKGVE